MRHDLRNTPIADIMTTQIQMVAQSTPIDFVAKLMRDKEISGLVVTTDEGAVAGVVSATDLLRAMPAPDPDRAAERRTQALAGSFYAEIKPSVLYSPDMFDEVEGVVRDFMSDVIVSVPLDATVQQAAQIMTDSGVHRLLVLDRNDNLAGLVTATDIVRHVAG